jgi:hypothetical protein
MYQDVPHLNCLLVAAPSSNGVNVVFRTMVVSTPLDTIH